MLLLILVLVVIGMAVHTLRRSNSRQQIDKVTSDIRRVLQEPCCSKVRDVSVKLLCETRESAKIIATWCFTEFEEANRDFDLYSVNEYERDLLTNYTHCDRIPLTLVALTTDGIACGTISLDTNDLNSHLHLSPWMASLYVAPAFRGRGIATLLMCKLKAIAIILKISTLYLWTTQHHQNLYIKHGWITLTPTRMNESVVYVMKLDFPLHPHQTVKLRNFCPKAFTSWGFRSRRDLRS